MTPTQQPNDDDSTDTPRHRDAAAYDTPDSDVRDDLIEHFESGEARDSEPVTITAAFRAVTLERVDLERDPGEPFADWIRQAVTQRLEIVDREPVAHDSRPAQQPARGTSLGDASPDERLVEVIGAAEAPGAWLPVDVELAAGDLEAIMQHAADQGSTPDAGFYGGDFAEDLEDALDERAVAEWIRTAVSTRFAAIDEAVELTPTLEIDVPAPIAERARLNAERWSARGVKSSPQGALYDELLELIDPWFEYRVDGEPIAERQCEEGETSP